MKCEKNGGCLNVSLKGLLKDQSTFESYKVGVGVNFCCKTKMVIALLRQSLAVTNFIISFEGLTAVFFSFNIDLNKMFSLDRINKTIKELFYRTPLHPILKLVFFITTTQLSCGYRNFYNFKLLGSLNILFLFQAVTSLHG